MSAVAQFPQRQRDPAKPNRRAVGYHGGFRFAMSAKSVAFGAGVLAYVFFLALGLFAVFGPSVAQCVRWL